MHKLLNRQLKKVSFDGECLQGGQLQQFLELVNQAYQDADEDRVFLENTLQISSEEMQELYKKLKIQSEKALALSEEKYRKLVENLQYYYIFFGYSRGGFNYISDSVETILGYSKEEFTQNYQQYLTDDPINRQVYINTRRAFQGKQPPPYQLSIRHKDGSIIYLEITALPVFDLDGKVSGIEGIARNITQEYLNQQKVNFLAQRDALTGLANRWFFENSLKQLIAESRRTHQQFALLLFDLDHFKKINDTLGHNIGDSLLKKLAGMISPNIRESDIFSRIGGDEFTIVLTNIEEADLDKVVSKILNIACQSIRIENKEINTSISMGVVLFPRDGNTIKDLMKRADIAMYQAKALGRNNFCFYTHELNQRVHEEMQLEQNLFQALENNEFVLYYQPKLELKSNKIIGAEALLRWQHPEKGLICPDKFITLVENTGYMPKLGQWVLEEGCRAINRFNQISREKIHVSLNVSVRQLQYAGFYQIVQQAIAKNAIDPTQLFLEITESLMLEDDYRTIDLLNKIKSLGIHLCMDDFGTGYSSLSYLHRFPIDSIKIDKAFIEHITPDAKDALLVDTIIAMGNTLKMPVIAEGVETQLQRDYLIDKGCQYYQGYWFSKPIPEKEFSQLIVHHPLKSCY